VTRGCTVLALAALALAGPRTAAAPQTSTTSTTSLEDVQRLRAYHDRIATVVKPLPSGVSLAELLRPVLQLAEMRATKGIASDENRVALITLCFYVNGWPIEALAQEARAWPRAEARGPVLKGRHDLAQHFIVSAVISAAAGSPIADAAGLYKEIDDARRGSGFSFSDLAADRAGTLFGQLAGQSPESARNLHARLTAGLTEADIMPSIEGLPDNLSEAEFTRRYGGVGAPAYKLLVSEIDRRVASLPLFQ